MVSKHKEYIAIRKGRSHRDRLTAIQAFLATMEVRGAV
jgi:hypothetical protein